MLGRALHYTGMAIISALLAVEVFGGIYADLAVKATSIFAGM